MAEVHPHSHARPSKAVGAVVALLSVVCATGVVVVARVDPVQGTRMGMVLAGVVALLSGFSVISVSRNRRHRYGTSERPRMLLGLVLIIWGTGQVLLGLQITDTGQRAFGAGDLVSMLCMPVLVMALISMPRHSRVSQPALRLALDSLTVTTVGVLAMWWLALQGVLADPGHPGGSAVTSVVMAYFDIGAAVMTTLIWIRDRRRGSPAVAVGLVLQAAADLSSLPAVVGDRPLPWVAGAIWCVALPLLAAGIINYATAPVSDGAITVIEDLGQSRVAMISTVVSLLGLAVLVGAPVTHRWTAVSAVLTATALTLLIARETLSGLIHNRMIRWLNAEALRDGLTGMPNRSALTTRIRTLDLSRPWVLLTVGLDGFKEINDMLGAEAGDEIIKLVGAALRAACPPGSMVARLGGDEFGVLAAGDPVAGEGLARQLHDAVHAAARERGGVTLSVSVGVGRVLPDEEPPADGDAAGARVADDPAAGHRDRLDALLEAAAALRAAKADGRDRIALYPGAVEQARRRRLMLERRLRAAIERDGLDMYAQPLVDLRTGRTTGFESLARWTDEVLGPVSPAEFVPVAEQTGLITALGAFALRNTLAQATAAGVTGRNVALGVNVSPIQLRDPSFAPMIVDLVAELGLRPGQLLLEVTEAVLVAEGDPAAGALGRLSDAGIPLAIDDFGTGYSALSYLRWLPIDELKIDRSWVVASGLDERTRDVVGGVVSLAHTLGAIVVMEGIEDEATAQLCRDLGADVGQGWLFGRPQPWPAAGERLEAECQEAEHQEAERREAENAERRNAERRARPVILGPPPPTVRNAAEAARRPA